MKRITRTVYLTKESIDLIEKDINAKQSYTVFSNKEEGTIELDITLSIIEEFNITEDLLMEIVTGLTPALSEKQQEEKLNQIISMLRTLGTSV
jgi:hypothetical protein